MNWMFAATLPAETTISAPCYDLAGFPVPRQLDALLALTTLEHLHYGSDYPFTPEPVVAHAASLLVSAGAVAEALAANTTALFPDLHRHGG